MAELTIIDGGRNAERLFRKLLDEPFAFDQETYEGLVERFRSRLTIDDILALAAKRLRGMRCADPLERDLLLAVAEGRFDDASRLHRTLRRRRLGLRVVTRGPASPPRSS